ncbi:MAG: flippase [Candidatus Micrarchaeaceae archaeon]
MMTNGPEIRGRLLARNTILNFVGLSTPLLVGIVCIPFLIRGLGIERFGILTLIWTVVGFMSIADLGLGRALTQFMAERLGKGQTQELPALVWTSLALIFALGVFGGLALAAVSPWLARDALRVPVALQSETIKASYLLAISIPLVLSITGLRGVLEALQRFGLSNAIRIPTGAFSFLGPLLVLPFSHSLVPVVAILVGGRFVSWFVYLIACCHAMPELRHDISFHPAEVTGLIGFGGWVTVSNIVNLPMVYLDRFLIGSLISIAAVAYYATPYDLVTKLWLVPGAVGGVFFPAFASTFPTDRVKASLLLASAVKFVFIILFPITLAVMFFAREGLTLWVGTKFAQQSTLPLQLLAVGAFASALAQMAFSAIQGVGRPDVTAKVHLCEVPLYIAGVVWLICTHGIQGAAIAWTVRVLGDTAVLFLLTRRLLPETVTLIRHILPAIALATAVFIFGALVHGELLKVLFLAILLTAFGTVAWFVGLVSAERRLIRGLLNGTSGQNI